MNTVATNSSVLDEVDFVHERPNFFRRVYIRMYQWWLYVDGKRVMRDYRKGKLHQIESLDELMK